MWSSGTRKGICNANFREGFSIKESAFAPSVTQMYNWEGEGSTFYSSIISAQLPGKYICLYDGKIFTEKNSSKAVHIIPHKLICKSVTWVCAHHQCTPQSNESWHPQGHWEMNDSSGGRCLSWVPNMLLRHQQKRQHILQKSHGNANTHTQLVDWCCGLGVSIDRHSSACPL